MPTAGMRVASGKKPGEDAAELPRQVLEKIVLRRGSLRGLGQQFGHSNMWLWRQVRHNKRMDLAKTGQVLAHLEVPPRFFYEEILDQTAPYDPVWVLEHFREGNDLPRDPFLEQVHDRLLALLDRPAKLGGPRRREEIAILDKRRVFDRQAAKRNLEQLMLELLAHAENPAGPSRGLLADLAHSMLLWAAIQRARGWRDDSVDACRLGYRLVQAGRDTKILGIFFYYASNLLVDLGQGQHALRFAERSCAILQYQRDSDLLAQALMQTAVALNALGSFAEARKQSIGALRIAPRRSWHVRFAAWLMLGNIAFRRTHLRKALARIRRAKALAHGSGYLRAYASWREAAIFGKMALAAEAIRSFQTAIDLFGKFGQPLDVAFVGVDLAEFLMASGRFAETLNVAKSLTPCFERFSKNDKVLALWMDLLALILQGSRDNSLAQVLLLRSALQEADPRTRLSKV